MKNQFTWYKLIRLEKIHNEVDTFFVKVDVDDICLDPMPNGNKRHNILNEKNLKGN